VSTLFTENGEYFMPSRNLRAFALNDQVLRAPASYLVDDGNWSTYIRELGARPPSEAMQRQTGLPVTCQSVLPIRTVSRIILGDELGLGMREVWIRFLRGMNGPDLHHWLVGVADTTEQQQQLVPAPVPRRDTRTDAELRNPDRKRARSPPSSHPSPPPPALRTHSDANIAVDVDDDGEEEKGSSDTTPIQYHYHYHHPNPCRGGDGHSIESLAPLLSTLGLSSAHIITLLVQLTDKETREETHRFTEREHEETVRCLDREETIRQANHEDTLQQADRQREETNRLADRQREETNREADWQQEVTKRYRVTTRPFTAELEGEIIANQHGRCKFCDVRLDHTCEVSHIKPLNFGGEHGPWNAHALCRDCNTSHGFGYHHNHPTRPVRSGDSVLDGTDADDV
jgi:5-methylcytosine-specific restriction endonuclease McrA